MKQEEHVFLEFSCFLYDPMDVGDLISGSSAFSKSSFYIRMGMDMSLRTLWEMVKDTEAWRAAAHGVAERQIQLSN